MSADPSFSWASARRWWFFALWVPLLGVANDDAHHDEAHLGTVDFPISCSAPAQAEFNRAMALLHHMTYPQAGEAFEHVVATDDRCAMAHWGVAMTLFQPLWPTRPSPEALQRGWDELQRAKTLVSTDRERLFIDTAEAFFTEPDSADYWLRIRRWESAAKKAYSKLPNDPEAALFFALAHLATTPATGNNRAHADAAAAIILRIYERNPDHPGTMHYLIHANDVPGRERELLDITHKYEAIAPNNPHALHMPTHIHTRLGDWESAIKGNQRAADAALLHPAGKDRALVWDEFPHAIEYLMYAYLQQGADDLAFEQLTRLRTTERLEPSFKTAFHLASTQARFALERRDWEEASQVAPRTPGYLSWDQMMWPEAIQHFARGLGAVHVHDRAKARAALMRLSELEAKARNASEDLFARNIEVLRLGLGACSAHEAGVGDGSIELMKRAVEIESATPKHSVTPAPTLPAYELLGDLYMLRNEPAKALDAYRESLERYPGRFNSWLGAAQAARANHDDAAARDYYAQLLEVARAGTRAAPLAEARAYLAARH